MCTTVARANSATLAYHSYDVHGRDPMLGVIGMCITTVHVRGSEDRSWLVGRRLGVEFGELGSYAA